MSGKSVTILIPNKNGRDLLKKHLPVVQSVKGVSQIIVIDDNSSDGSYEYIRKSFPTVKVVRKNSPKSGFSSSINSGLSEVKTEYVCLLNTDVVPQTDCIEKSMKYFADPDMFAVGFLDRSHDEGGIVLRGRGIASWRNGFYAHERGDVDKKETAWVSGGSGIFRMSILKILGGFDELYDPFYWEDIDLSYRARKAGYRLKFAPECQVDHYHETGSIKSSYTASWVSRIAFRNELLFHWKNITDPGLLILHGLALVKHLLRALITFDKNSMVSVIMALSRLPAVIKRRCSAPKSVITDTEITTV